jgi:hypothetical protein
VIGLGGIARGRADTLVLFGDQRIDVGRFVGGIAPQGGANFLVQPFGKGLGQAVGQGRGEDGGIVVAGVLEPFGDLQSRRDRR